MIKKENKKNWKLKYNIREGKTLYNTYSGYSGEEEENFIWEDTAKFEGFGRGCSSAVFYFKFEELGQNFNMFMTDMNDLIVNHGIKKGGNLKGKFTFIKRGSNYGVQYLGK